MFRRLCRPSGSVRTLAIAPAAAADGQLAFGADDTAEAEALMTQARAVLDLGAAFDERLGEVGARDLLHDVELPTSVLLARLERHGIAADRDHLEAMEQQFAGAVQQAVKEAHASVGHEFNLGSPKQLQEVFFGELNLPILKDFAWPLGVGFVVGICWKVADPVADQPDAVLVDHVRRDARHVSPAEFRHAVQQHRAVRVAGRQHAGMERSIAISAPLVGSVRLYSSIVSTAPGDKTRIHHHGDCETSIYILSGEARYTWGPTGLEHTFDAVAGDFIYIPAGEIHVEENASTAEPLVVVLTRNCPDSHVVYLDGGPDGADDVPAPC